jgi:hypothetical protein
MGSGKGINEGNACIKCHNETYYFIQLIYVNLKTEKTKA